jgi:hypothetical protein
MKVYFLRKIFLCLFASGSLFLISCEEDMDLDHFSKDVSAGGSITIPVLSEEFKVTLREMLEQYDTNGIINTDDDDIYWSDTVIFPTLKMSELNQDFGTFSDNMNDFGLPIPVDTLKMSNILGERLKDYPFLLDMWDDGLKIQLPKSIEVPPYTDSIWLDISDQFKIDGETNKQRIDSIRFRNRNKENNTRLQVTIDYNLSPDILELEITFPGHTAQSIPIKKGTQPVLGGDGDFTIAGGNILYTLKVKGDGETEIDKNSYISIQVDFISGDKLDYVVYGLFNYDTKLNQDIKAHDIMANLYDYIPEGSSLSLTDPQFQFNLTSNLGIPLVFRLDKITSYLSGEPKTFEPNSTNKYANMDIKCAEKIGDIVIDSIKINNDLFREDGKEFSEYITTSLDSLTFDYRLAAKEVDVNDRSLPIEFIPSDVELESSATLKVPMAFGAESVIHYNNTISLDFDSSSLEILEKVDSLTLGFHYENHIPLGFYVDLYLLDSAHKNIPDNDAIYQSISMNKPKVDGQTGIVVESAEGDFSLVFTKGTEISLSKLKEAKYLLLKYKSKKENVLEGPIRLKANDYISIKSNVTIEGGITLDLAKKPVQQ